MTDDPPPDLRARLARRFEIGCHALTFIDERAGRLTFRSPRAEAVHGRLLTPATPPPWPVVLVIHAHGDRYDIGSGELTSGRPASPAPLGPALVARGIAAICVDLPCFGTRRAEREGAAAKAALWRGGSLAGRMLGELSSQLDWLSGDARFGPVAVCGLSMGATLGYWLAAVDARVAALAQLCCLADMDALIDTGAHDLHGAYLTVPGLPALARNGQIAGLVAPRPQFVGLGGLDPLTPPVARDRALADLRAGYAGCDDALRILVDENSGHVETPAMRAALLRFIDAALR